MVSLDWLKEPWQEGLSTTKFERYAQLVYMNGGGSIVKGWGVITNGGAYGRMGLTQDEALELLEMNGVICGFMWAEDMEHWDELKDMLRREWGRVEGFTCPRNGTLCGDYRITGTGNARCKSYGWAPNCLATEFKLPFR